MAKRRSISRSKDTFSKFLQLYLHSVRARLVFWIVVFGAGKPKEKISYKSRLKVINYFHRLWIAHRPKLSSIYSDMVLARLVALAAVLGGVMIVAQLLYPSDRSLPLSRLEGNGRVSFARETDIKELIENLSTRSVAVQTPTTSVSATFEEMGLTVDPKATFDQIRDYSLKERLTPFSLFFSSSREVPIVRVLDEAKFADFTDGIITNASEPPESARVTLNGTRLVVEPARDGFAYRHGSLKTQLLGAGLYSDSPLLFKPDLVSPDITTAQARDQAERMQERIDTPLQILASGHSLDLPKSAIASWVEIEHKPKDKKVEITLDKDRIRNSLQPMRQLIDKDPVPILVTLLNGVEAGRTSGELGALLNTDKLVNDIVQWEFAPQPNVWGQVESISPSETIERRYTRDSAGLQSLIDYWASTKPGLHGVYFRTADGLIIAGKNPDQQFNINGLAGIFIAHQIYGRIAAGTLSSSSPTSVGSSVGTCLSSMITSYDMSCMSALGNIIGWSSSNSMLKQQGFGNSSLASGAAKSTAADTAYWFSAILNRAITTSGQTNSLIAQMSIQTQRAGIPSGSLGIQVANQAGISSSGVVADFGIIFHPRDNYVLSVLSHGITYADIAELAQEINRILYE